MYITCNVDMVLSHFDNYVYVNTQDQFADAGSVNKYGVDETLLALLKGAGADLKAKYTIDERITNDDVLVGKYAQLKEDPMYALVSSVNAQTIAKYNIDDKNVSQQVRGERLGALKSDIVLAKKTASLKQATDFSKTAYGNKTATNINTDGDNNYEKTVASQNVYARWANTLPFTWPEPPTVNAAQAMSP